MDSPDSADMSGQPSRPSPWIRLPDHFHEAKSFNKSDLSLPHFKFNNTDNCLLLDESNYLPISKGWGFCLIGIFAGRFPGKESIYGLMKRWPRKSIVSFHSNGWMVFQFATEEDMETTRQMGPFSVFGIPLILNVMPQDFRFEATSDFSIPVWINLPNLPLELWNKNALGKIGSVVGKPIGVDFHTLQKIRVDRARIQVEIDASRELPTEVSLRLHNGNTFAQSLVYDFVPKFCRRCKRFGHLIVDCKVSDEELSSLAKFNLKQSRGKGIYVAGNRNDNKNPNGTRNMGRSKSRPTADKSYHNQRRSKSRTENALQTRGRTEQRAPHQQRARSRQGPPQTQEPFHICYSESEWPLLSVNIAKEQQVNAHIRYPSPDVPPTQDVNLSLQELPTRKGTATDIETAIAAAADEGNTAINDPASDATVPMTGHTLEKEPDAALCPTTSLS